jgi:hypothetical protein
MGRPLIASLAEINSRCAVEPATSGFGGLNSGGNGRQRGAHIRAWGDLEDLHLTLIPSSARRVAETHVVSKSVHSAALDRSKVRRENNGVATGIFLK